ncbi:MAG: hypothetical protein ACQ9MH_01475 [Nitrospinales bacterium]
MSYLLRLSFFLTIFNLSIIPVMALAQSDCGVPELFADQIHEIIIKERANRDDLPSAYKKYEYKVTKRGCYYTYYETLQPYTMHQSRAFTLNRFGAIVSVVGGHADVIEIKCPKKVFSKSELAEIMKRERELRKDLPPPYLNYSTSVIRSGCLYLFAELELPEGSSNYQYFVIDPFGELMDYSLP